MENKFKVTVPKPCHENWNLMNPTEKGRFCDVCTKSVVDFTDKSSTEIQEYFLINKNQRVCGRFRNEQISKFDIKIPITVLIKQKTFQKAFLLALFIAMGSSLFSCKNHNDETLGEVSVVDSTKQIKEEPQRTMGIILPPKEKETLIGDTIYISTDSTKTKKIEK